MKIIAEPLKLFDIRDAGQPQICRPFAVPFATHLLAFRVILANSQVVPEISFGVSQAALRFGRKHDPKIRRSKPTALMGSGRVYAGYLESLPHPYSCRVSCPVF